MENAATRQAPWSYPTILGEAMETSASSEARSAPLPYPTWRLTGRLMHTADNCFRVAHDTPGVRDSCNSRTPSLSRVASRSRKARLTRAGYAFDERTPVEFIMKDTGGPPARRKRKTKPAVSAGRKGASSRNRSRTEADTKGTGGRRRG